MEQINITPYISSLFLAFSTYIFVTASPGPANMAIMATSMQDGRKSGVALACGVIAGSQCWGILAAVGVSSIVATFPAALRAIGILGGIYFLWLAYKALRSALQDNKLREHDAHGRSGSFFRYFLQGFGIHIVNPKAILGWISIITLGVGSGAPAYVAFFIIFGCLILGTIIFGTYAIAFSTPVMIRAYTHARRWIQSVVAIMFSFAAFGLLMAG